MLFSNDGHSHTQIAKFLKVSRTSVNKLVQSFLEERQEKPSTGGFEKIQNRNDP
ncbi:TPA: helix-turn-helix domain-containing protein [Vibrio parahaemolyticus]